MAMGREQVTGLYHQIVEMWQGWQVRTVSGLEIRLDSFRIQFAFHSARLENEEVDYQTARELFSDGRVHSFRGDPHTLAEIHGQKSCHGFLLPKIAGIEPLSVALVKEVHALLTGTWDSPTRSPRAEAELAALLREVNATGDLTPEKTLRTAAYLHAGLCGISPFITGNELVGRSLLNYYLLTNDHPPLIFHEDARSDYHEALEKYIASGGLEPFCAYLTAQAERSWEKTWDRRNGVYPQRSRGLADFLA